MLNRVDHIDVRTPDFDGTVEFFRALGLDEVRRTHPDRASVELALPGEGQVVFEVRLDEQANATYIHHVAFHSDDAEAAVRAISDRGVTFSKKHELIEHTGRTISNAHDAGGGTWQVTD